MDAPKIKEEMIASLKPFNTIFEHADTSKLTYLIKGIVGTPSLWDLYSISVFEINTNKQSPVSGPVPLY